VQVLPMGVGVPFRLNGSEDCDRSHAEHGPPEDAFGGTRSVCPRCCKCYRWELACRFG